MIFEVGWFLMEGMWSLTVTPLLAILDVVFPGAVDWMTDVLTGVLFGGYQGAGMTFSIGSLFVFLNSWLPIVEMVTLGVIYIYIHMMIRAWKLLQKMWMMLPWT